MAQAGDIITPTPLSGFPEFLPDAQLQFNRCADIVRHHFEQFGAVPLETPAFEKKQILSSKGGDDKQIYSVARLAYEGTDKEQTDYALRFDQTVPLARYVAQHYSELSFPFRRYQMQDVWRGERAQAGRFRQFRQADIDVIGDGSLSLHVDAEIPAIICGIFKDMGIGDFLIRVNNRRLLEGVLASLGIPGDAVEAVLRTIDKLEKVGPDKVYDELVKKFNVSEASATKLLELSEVHGTIDTATPFIQALDANQDLEQGLEELTNVCRAANDLGVPADSFEVDLSIARGLGYYTGTVYETALVDHPAVGSICSGGRYENLASKFTNRKLPGVGISIGLTRLVSRLLDAEILPRGPATPAKVLVTTMVPEQMSRYLALASTLRSNGIATEVYFEPRRIGDQLKFAGKKGFPYVVIGGPSELETGTWQLKDFASGEQKELSAESIVEELKHSG